jgi:hypothetical protein
MEEREKHFIFLVERSGYKGFDWRRDQGDVRGAVHWVSKQPIMGSYLYTLTDKQIEAFTFIRMLPEWKFVEGIGAWVDSAVQYGKVYIIDC